MPQKGTIYRILVASPSDCNQERRIIPEVIHLWNAANSLHTATILEPVMWETHSWPRLGDRPQEIINKQMVEHCDFIVATFWTRLGTPTGEAESGTAEEIEKFRNAGKPVMLYFSSSPVVPESIDQSQYSSLLEYRNKLQDEGLYHPYQNIAEFRVQFQQHLSAQMTNILSENPSNRSPEEKKNEEDQNQLNIFKNQLAEFTRRLEIEWSSERDSEPVTIDEGKYVMQRALDEILHFRSMVVEDKNEVVTGIFEDIAKQLRIMARHRLYLDGGKSFKEFWEIGDGVIKKLNDLVKKIS